MATLTEDKIRADNKIVIDFLYLDLNTCTRCVGTDRNLEEALAAVRQLVEQTGTRVEVRKHLVETAEMARKLQLVSSPTIRVNGTDIALELKETPCGTEACTDGGGEHIACRVWTYQGEELTEAPTGLIIDAVLREIYAPHPQRSTGAEPYELPENLQRFFHGKAGSTSCCGPGGCGRP